MLELSKTVEFDGIRKETPATASQEAGNQSILKTGCFDFLTLPLLSGHFEEY
jgi:hypothetical protein